MSRKFRDAIWTRDRRLGVLAICLAFSGMLDFAFRLFSPHPPLPGNPPPENLQPLLVPRPDPAWAGSLFNLTEHFASDRNAVEPPIDEESQEGSLTALMIDRESYRLRACFLVDGASPAAAVQQEADDGFALITLLSVGDNLGPYKVAAIQSSSLLLKTEKGREVVLQMFAPAFGAPQVKK